MHRLLDEKDLPAVSTRVIVQTETFSSFVSKIINITGKHAPELTILFQWFLTFSRLRFIRTYQLVRLSTNLTSRGTTVYRRYAAISCDTDTGGESDKKVNSVTLNRRGTTVYRR